MVGAGVSERSRSGTSEHAVYTRGRTWHGMEEDKTTYSKPIPMVTSLVGSPSYVGEKTVVEVGRYCLFVVTVRSSRPWSVARWSGVACHKRGARRNKIGSMRRCAWILRRRNIGTPILILPSRATSRRAIVRRNVIWLDLCFGRLDLISISADLRKSQC